MLEIKIREFNSKVQQIAKANNLSTSEYTHYDHLGKVIKIRVALNNREGEISIGHLRYSPDFSKIIIEEEELLNEELSSDSGDEEDKKFYDKLLFDYLPRMKAFAKALEADKSISQQIVYVSRSS